jgi:hypothetical protein
LGIALHDVSIEERGGRVNSFVLLLGIWLGFACWFASGWGFSASNIADYCQDFGKVEIKGKWYECRPMDALK